MDLLVGNLLVIFPVIAVVAGVVLVFMFGFKQPDELKFKKSSAGASDSNKKPKKKETKVNGSFNGNWVDLMKTFHFNRNL